MFSGKFRKNGSSLLVVGLSKTLKIFEANPTMRAHHAEGNLLLVEQRNEKRSRYVQKIGGLLGCELSMNRNDGDGVAVGHLCEHLKQSTKSYLRKGDGHRLSGPLCFEIDGSITCEIKVAHRAECSFSKLHIVR